jgi:hypothetical protein
MVHEAAEPRGRLRYEYATGAVGTSTWVLVGAMPTGTFSTVEIYDSGTFCMEMKLDTAAGTSASTYFNMYIMPGGNGRIPLRVDGGSSAALNLYIRAVGTGASATAGQFIINFW